MNPEPIYVGLQVWGGFWAVICVWGARGRLGLTGKITFVVASLALCIGLAGVLL